jgi:protein TonB
MTGIDRRNYGIALALSIGLHILIGMIYLPKYWPTPTDTLETFPVGTVELAGRPDGGKSGGAAGNGGSAARLETVFSARKATPAKTAAPPKPKLQERAAPATVPSLPKTVKNDPKPEPKAAKAAPKAEPAPVAAKLPDNPPPGPALAVGQKGPTEPSSPAAVHAAGSKTGSGDAKPAATDSGSDSGTAQRTGAVEKGGGGSGGGDGSGTGSGSGGSGDGTGSGSGSGPIGFGTGAKMTVLGPPPAYPKNALNEGKEGRVKIRILVRANGSLEKVQLLDSAGDQRLDNIVLNQVGRRWKFTPTSVDYLIDLTFVFNAKKAQVGIIFENAESR